MRNASRSGIPIDFDSLPTRYSFTLMVSQAVTERVLLQRLRELTEYIDIALADRVLGSPESSSKS
jgi:hypothetical protein